MIRLIEKFKQYFGLVSKNPIDSRMPGIEDLSKMLEHTAARVEACFQRLEYFEKQQQVISQMGEILTERVAALSQEIVSLEDYRLFSLWKEISCKIDKEEKVVFMSRGFFGDNIKYVLIEFNKLFPSSYIYLTRDPTEFRQLHEAGFKVALWDREDVRLINYLLRAKVLVLCDHFVPWTLGDSLPVALLAGAKVIQLWHGGIGYKKIALENLKNVGLNLAFLTSDFLHTHIVNARSSNLVHLMKKSFQPDQIVSLGYPRLDIFYRNPDESDLINVDVDLYKKLTDSPAGYRKIILYAPTFCDNHDNGHWFQYIDFMDINQRAIKTNSLFIINLHPYEQHLASKISDSVGNENVGCYIVRPKSDIYPILKLVDILVTDYSSIFADFCWLDKPIIFFRPDHIQYTGKQRELNALPVPLPGPVVKTHANLVEMVFEKRL